jgi:gluconolactonase
VYRIEPTNGQIAMVTDEIRKPNGICFSPDYKRVYVADTGATHYDDAARVVKVFDINGKTLSKGRQFVSMEIPGKGAGLADGIRADTDGNIWIAAGWVGAGYDGVHIVSPEGERIGQILLPEICSNLCFGGPKRNRLFMTAGQSLYTVYVEARGAHIT